MVVEGEKVVMEVDGGGKGTKKWRRWWRKWWGMVSDGAKCADKVEAIVDNSRVWKNSRNRLITKITKKEKVTKRRRRIRRKQKRNEKKVDEEAE